MKNNNFSVVQRTVLAPMFLRFDGLLLLPVIIYLSFILPIYVENNAGSGLSLPQNIVSWGCIAFFILLVTSRTVISGRIYISKFMLWATLATVLLVLPWFWTSSTLWQHHALPRLAGIAGGLFFTFSLCQIRLNKNLRRLILAVIVFSALIQSAESMLQAWLPNMALRLMDFSASSPYGIFQQKNLLASWLATGFGINLYLARTSRSRTRTIVWILALYPLCTGIILSESRIGGLAALVMMMVNMVSDVPNLRHRPLAVLHRVMLISSLIVWCTGISLWAMPSGKGADFSHTASTEQRLTVLIGTAKLIAKHPVTGSGLGSFESQFPQALEEAGLESRENDTFTHPHNEVMYVMAEGGVIALAGLMILAGVWLWPFLYFLSRLNSRWLLPLTGLPIIMHMMTEYPLYLSSPHFMLLLLLFRIGIPDSLLSRVRMGALIRIIALPTVCLASILSLFLLNAGFSVQKELTQAECDMNSGLIPSLPKPNWRNLTQAERLSRDRFMLKANTPAFTRDTHAMAEFTIWGTRWLSVHNDADVSAALIFIAGLRGDQIQVKQLRKLAGRVFVSDERFKQMGK